MAVVVPYHEQLLEQAQRLLTGDRTRPAQASVRRAASAAYYAVFHYMAEEMARQVVGSSAGKALRIAVTRALEHGALRSAAERFSSQAAPGNLPLSLKACLKSVSPDLQGVASAIVWVQDVRHRADYDRAIHMQKIEGTVALAKARSVISAWARLSSEERSTFLVSVLLWKALSGR